MGALSIVVIGSMFLGAAGKTTAVLLPLIVSVLLLLGEVPSLTLSVSSVVIVAKCVPISRSLVTLLTLLALSSRRAVAWLVTLLFAARVAAISVGTIARTAVTIVPAG